MKRDPLVYGIIGFLIGGVIVWFLATTAVNNNQYGMMQMMGLRGGTQNMMGSSRTIDAHFIEQMIPHHEDAITMAKLALTKAKRIEVKELAQNIIDSQGKEIEQMKDWYKSWFGREVPADTQVMGQHGMMGGNGMHMGMMGDESDITRLEDAADFDRVFVEEMIPHHQMAVMMASMLKNGTQRSEMKKLADDIIAAQTNEIDLMRDWLQNWGE
ncbi:MAG: DUF305 domain-containing protein [Candidatus Levybacteria bacterium]|nr:DUF305 domain-containing protein [Candidatus Levybacteria bacterium]